MQFSCKKSIFLLRKWKKRPKNEKKIAAKPRARRAVCTRRKTKIWRFLKREYWKWSQRAILSRLAKEFSKKLDYIFLSGSSKLGSILGNLCVWCFFHIVRFRVFPYAPKNHRWVKFTSNSPDLAGARFQILRLCFLDQLGHPEVAVHALGHILWTPGCANLDALLSFFETRLPLQKVHSP